MVAILTDFSEPCAEKQNNKKIVRSGTTKCDDDNRRIAEELRAQPNPSSSLPEHKEEGEARVRAVHTHHKGIRPGYPDLYRAPGVPSKVKHVLTVKVFDF